MTFRLRYDQHDFELSEGQFVIGRAPECQLSLDDALVSRRHALLIVDVHQVTVEDLGSRNGVVVNGERIEGRQALKHGDLIAIGGQQMTLLGMSSAQTETGVQPPPTQRFGAFGVLGGLADKALALGRAADAERILNGALAELQSEIDRGNRPNLETLADAARFAIRLAQMTGKSRWVDYVFELYTPHATLCPADVIDQLYEVMRKVRYLDSSRLRQYIASLRALNNLGPSERFLLGRVEGLERVVGSR